MKDVNISKVQTVLEDLIDKKRIVFWYDNGGQWASVVDNLNISGVTRLNLAGNPFSIKYHVLKGEQPSRGFLIYSKDERPADADNWLLDLETEGIIFSADVGSLYAAECGIPMELKHKVVDPFIQFFKSEDNRKQLSKLTKSGMDWQKIIWHMIGITAKTEPTYDQILLAMVKGLSNEDNSISDNLVQFGLADTFWSEIKELFGYAGNESLKELLIVLFKDDMIRYDGHKHLTNAAHIFMRDWRDSRTYSEVYKTWANILEIELGVERELEDYTLEQLIEIETFPCVDKLIAIRLQQEVMNHTMTSEQMGSIVRTREHKIFWTVAEHTIRAMVEARKVVAGIKHTMPGLVLNTPEEAFRLYCSELYRIDSDYRHFFREAKLAESKNLIAPIVEMVQKVYSNSYLDELARKWQPLVDSMSKWRFNYIDSQSNFYQYHVKPFIDKNRKVFVIISDGMRYETMMELQERIEAVNRTETKMRPAMVSTLPSYTQLGMASLLPHRELGYDKDQDEVFADGVSTKGTPARQNILQRHVPKSWAVTAEKFLEVVNPKSVFKDYDLVYIYSDQIDFVGDKLATEGKVFQATEEEFDRIVKIVELIRNGNGSNILITADHGYIYQNETLDESEFSDFKAEGKVITDTRRFVVGSELERAPLIKTWSSEDVGLKPGKEIQIAKGMNRMRKQGSGSRYVHGGSMLQEIVIPVLHVNIKKGSNISQVDVDILNRRSKITTNKQTISFYQTEAVSEKVTPITLRVGFYDDNNNLLSDSPILTFSTTSEDATQREQKHVFIFQNRISSLNGKEVVLRMERQILNTDQFVTYKEEAYKVSVMFANEF